MALKENDIIDLFFARSEEALSARRAQYGAYLRVLAGRILTNREDAEEAENDAYLDAWNTIPPKHPESLKGYLAMLCRRRALDMVDRRDSKKRGGGEQGLIFEEIAESLPGGEDGREWAGRISLREALEAFVTGLPERERNIFLQRYWYCLSIREIAEKHGLTENHVKVLLHRLRRKLKQQLEKEGVL